MCCIYKEQNQESRGIYMKLIIGVRFRKLGKVYYFDPTGFSVSKGDHVIVETVRGIEYGTIVLEPREVEDSKVVSPLKTIIRVATPEDDITNQKNEESEKEAFNICLEKIQKHQLGMKLIDSEYTFDRNKLLFYFTADGRIDFRELVKDLASVFRTRIELRQVGVRDETKMLGGIAICGRPLCCHSYLHDFVPVSIKMAKEQNLSLNPAKISGVCGRLMCCLKNEEEAYEYLNSTLPHLGAHVKTLDGYQGEVQSVNVLKQRVKVIITQENDEKEVREYPVTELSFDNRNRSKGAPVAPPLPDEEIDDKELEQLKIMEEQDFEELTEDADDEEQIAHSVRHSNHSKPSNTRDGRGNKGHDRQENYRGRRDHSDKEPRPYHDRGQSDAPNRDKRPYYDKGQSETPNRDKRSYYDNDRKNRSGRDKRDFKKDYSKGENRGEMKNERNRGYRGNNKKPYAGHPSKRSNHSGPKKTN